MQNYVGQQIDRYRITERLGMGGMAVVYKAYDTRLERDVALKLIRTESIPQDQHERLFKRFEREAKAQARFKHPHIVAVHDYGEVDNSPYLVMDFISGGTLKDRLHGPVDWRQAVRWLIPVAEALSYAHHRGVIHRDVKPANILFDEEGQPILTDFGIAKVLETDEATLTGTGLGVGTPDYMAPEQWQGKTSAATDQYALGVVLYELITGRKPYSADTPAAIILMQVTEPLAPPSNLVSGIPEQVENVLYKALARNPQDRYEKMDAFTLALRGLLAEADTAESVLPVGESAKEGWTYTPEASAESESETRDAFNNKPMEKIGATIKAKRRLPKWALWAGIGIIGLSIISFVIGIGGNFVDMGKGDTEPLAILVTETATATARVDITMTKISTPAKTVTNTPTPEPTLGTGSTMINEKDGAELVYVPAGEFLMGSAGEFLMSSADEFLMESKDADSFSDEAPEHTVYLDGYWIYRYEVTNAQYRQCIEEGVCSETRSPYPQNNYPAVEIDWYEATEYCAWAGGRLPTEAEWEKAARGTEGQTYPWGETSPNCNLSNYSSCKGSTMPIGSYPAGASPYGALDMAGNVYEWVADWYDADYYQTSPSSNPTGPTNGSERVLRGGAWINLARFLRASLRSMIPPSYSYFSIGFRCVSRETP